MQCAESDHVVEQSLNALNPGVTAWMTVSKITLDENRPWALREERLGYDKTKGRWGLTLHLFSVDDPDGDWEEIDAWLFNDAPRSLRLRAVERVPELIEALAREATHTAERVSEGAGYARELARAISALAKEKRNRS